MFTFFKNKKKANTTPIYSDEAEKETYSFYDPDAPLLPCSFTLPSWTIGYEDNLLRCCTDFLSKVHPDEYNCDIFDKYISNTCHLLREQLNMQLSKKQHSLIQMEKTQLAKSVRIDESIKQLSIFYDQLCEELKAV